MLSMMLSAVDAKDAVKGVASKAAAGAQRMAGLEPKQGTHTHTCHSTPHLHIHVLRALSATSTTNNLTVPAL